MLVQTETLGAHPSTPHIPRKRPVRIDNSLAPFLDGLVKLNSSWSFGFGDPGHSRQYTTLQNQGIDGLGREVELPGRRFPLHVLDSPRSGYF